MVKIKGIKKKKFWAVFSPSGNIQFTTISNTRKEAQYFFGEKAWKDYAAAGFTTNKVLVDIKLL